MPLYSFEERARLAHALFGKVEPDDFDDRLSFERRCRSIADMAALIFRREVPRQDARRQDSGLSRELIEDSVILEPFQEEPDLFPLHCPSTVCLFCMRD